MIKLHYFESHLEEPVYSMRFDEQSGETYFLIFCNKRYVWKWINATEFRPLNREEI